MQENKRAFTLIELLVVVLIIGILSAIALPQYRKAVMKSRLVQAKVLVNALASAEERYYLANGAYTTTWDDLDIDVPAYSDEFVNGSGIGRTFPWGSCTLWGYGGGSVGCVSGQLSYSSSYEHSDKTAYASKYMCQAKNTNLASVENQICKAETGRTAPSETGDNYMIWYY